MIFIFILLVLLLMIYKLQKLSYFSSVDVSFDRPAIATVTPNMKYNVDVFDAENDTQIADIDNYVSAEQNVRIISPVSGQTNKLKTEVYAKIYASYDFDNEFSSYNTGETSEVFTHYKYKDWERAKDVSSRNDNIFTGIDNLKACRQKCDSDSNCKSLMYTSGNQNCKLVYGEPLLTFAHDPGDVDILLNRYRIEAAFGYDPNNKENLIKNVTIVNETSGIISWSYAEVGVVNDISKDSSVVIRHGDAADYRILLVKKGSDPSVYFEFGGIASRLFYIVATDSNVKWETIDGDTYSDMWAEEVGEDGSVTERTANANMLHTIIIENKRKNSLMIRVFVNKHISGVKQYHTIYKQNPPARIVFNLDSADPKKPWSIKEGGAILPEDEKNENDKKDGLCSKQIVRYKNKDMMICLFKHSCGYYYVHIFVQKDKNDCCT